MGHFSSPEISVLSCIHSLYPHSWPHKYTFFYYKLLFLLRWTALSSVLFCFYSAGDCSCQTRSLPLRYNPNFLSPPSYLPSCLYFSLFFLSILYFLLLFIRLFVCLKQNLSLYYPDWNVLCLDLLSSWDCATKTRQIFMS